MSLIIAIEPDREQAAQLQDLVRRHTRAELILADTTARAIGAMEERVPDLVLIPAFLSPQDDEALTAALRSHESAQHVQTLTIPVLGEPSSKTGAQGVLSRLRGSQRPASPDSCDPRLFAEQITEYLDRVAKDRGLVTSGNGKGPHGNNGHKPQASPAPLPKAPAPAKPAPPPVVKAAAPPETEMPATPPPNRLVAPPPPPRRKDAEGVTVARPASPAPARADAAESSNAPDATAEFAADDLAAAMDAALATENDDDLAQGLSSLMEKLSAEDEAEAEPAVAQKPSPADAARAAAQLTQLKELESLEYAMPKNIMFREDQPTGAEGAPPAPDATAAPASQPAPRPTTAPAPAPKDDWGDILASLKKDLGK